MLAMPQMRPAKTETLPSPNGTKNDGHQVQVTYEGAPSPRELLESVVIQAQAAIKGLQSDVEVSPFEGMTAGEIARMSKAEAEVKRQEAEAKRKTSANAVLRDFWWVA
jgi:hypothetical protein